MFLLSTLRDGRFCGSSVGGGPSPSENAMLRMCVRLRYTETPPKKLLSRVNKKRQVVEQLVLLILPYTSLFPNISVKFSLSGGSMLSDSGEQQRLSGVRLLKG